MRHLDGQASTAWCCEGVACLAVVAGFVVVLNTLANIFMDPVEKRRPERKEPPSSSCRSSVCLTDVRL